MQWLTDLIKHLTVTRPFAGALFITSGVFLWGPRYWPNQIGSIPNQWAWVLLPIFVFTLAIQLIWYTPMLLHTFSSSLTRFTQHPRLVSVSPEELRMLRYLSQFGDESVTLDSITKASPSINMIDLLAVSEKLQTKELIEVNPYNSHLISLSPKGIKVVLYRRNLSLGA